ncbi:ribonuclease H-like domain-containing protein [Tanacetum coccineum]
MHPMATRAKAGIFKPLKCMNSHVNTTSPIPLSHIHTLRDSNWKEAMLDEYNGLVTNGTWVLVPRLANIDVVRSMWLFKHKFHADGSLSQHYGLGFSYLLLYVDDIIPTASSTTLLQHIISSFHGEFAMTDLGTLNYFLGIYAQRTASGLFLSQSKFAKEILERAHMLHYNPSKILLILSLKLDRKVVRLLASLPMDIVYILEIIFYLGLLNDMLLLSHSSVEAEYHGVANVVTKTAWILYLSTNLVQHQRTKHIEIDIHFVHVYVASGQVRVLHVPSRYPHISTPRELSLVLKAYIVRTLTTEIQGWVMSWLKRLIAIVLNVEEGSNVKAEFCGGRIWSFVLSLISFARPMA